MPSARVSPAGLMVDNPRHGYARTGKRNYHFTAALLESCGHFFFAGQQQVFSQIAGGLTLIATILPLASINRHISIDIGFLFIVMKIILCILNLVSPRGRNSFGLLVSRNC